MDTRGPGKTNVGERGGSYKFTPSSLFSLYIYTVGTDAYVDLRLVLGYQVRVFGTVKFIFKKTLKHGSFIGR